MLINQQFSKVIKKVRNMESTYNEYIFKRIGEVDSALYITQEHLRMPPEAVSYAPVKKGDIWGGEQLTGWFKARLVIDQEFAGKRLFLRADTGNLETLLFVNGVPKGIFANKALHHTHGNHYSLLLTPGEKEGAVIDIALEAYCWHNIAGTMPFDQPETFDRKATFNGLFIEEMQDDIKDFVFSLNILNDLAENLPDDFRRAEIESCLLDLYNIVPQKPDECEEEVWRTALHRACEKMKPLLEEKNPASAPYAGVIGHSHMDTAWLWTRDETIRKIARTTSNALSLMNQYPDYKFFQSSVFHSELMRREYPAIYEEMKKRVQEGRFEPNGGVWVECDCNLVSGESLIRQLLWGQRWNKEHFNYRSDTFWLPDTFGYSAALPQIMEGCGISYFLTTKLSWNDTNAFPYDTFYWRGIDGSKVLTHFNRIHCRPDAASLTAFITGKPDDDKEALKYKRLNNRRLIAYGYGDGGGGPSYDMVESAIRLSDVNGCPKVYHTNVSSFMKELDETSKNLPVYSGELYLELHRGTLSGKSRIKRNNRKAEIALHDLDFASAAAHINGKTSPDYRDLYETLLVNQFHDILPGTCIPPVNERAIREVSGIIQKSEKLFHRLMQPDTMNSSKISLVNTTSWHRTDVCLPNEGKKPAGSSAQAYTDLCGNEKLYVEQIEVPALSQKSFELEALEANSESVFRCKENSLETPCLSVIFDSQGFITSLIEKASNRQLKKKGGYALNTFLIGEDVPLIYDNWDIDEDAFSKLKPSATLLNREIVADGALQFRIRSRYALGRASTLTQDMVFYANTPRIDFKTEIDWHETHQLLKTAFDIDLIADTARHEIQFGYVTRPTFKRNSYEQAMFEVVNHQYTDLSETRFGVAILNDCKYGISVDGTLAALTLMKTGTHPDPNGEPGKHSMTYSLLPHRGFSAENVVRPAYELNKPMHVVKGAADFDSLLTVSAGNIIIETVKVAEDGNGIIARLYECERNGCEAKVLIQFPHSKVYETNMLEENQEELAESDGLTLKFSAFQIRTIRIV